jgi:hypothetical protein
VGDINSRIELKGVVGENLGEERLVGRLFFVKSLRSFRDCGFLAGFSLSIVSGL